MENPPKKEIGLMCVKILKKEKVKYDNKHLIDIIQKTYPDIRKCINVLQDNTIDGKLIGSKLSTSEGIWEEIFKATLKQDIEKVRELLKSNFIEYSSLYEYFYERAGEFKQPPMAVLLIGKYLYQDATIAIKEINFMTMIMEMIYEEVI
jgi:DNA polymerase III delta prime subunit